jgi:hypothetical protein
VKFKSRALLRKFELHLDRLGLCRDLVEGVFDCLASKTIRVHSPHDSGDPESESAEEGPGASRPRHPRRVNIADWFACACQRIRLEDESGRDQKRPGRTAATLAWYANNFDQTLLPVDSSLVPIGPCGVEGEIVLTRTSLSLLQRGEIDAFRFVVAHEVTHALDALTWVVPAFQDWDHFRESVDYLLSGPDDIREILHQQWHATDDYGSPKELEMVERYWPGHAKQWLEAFRGRPKTPAVRATRRAGGECRGERVEDLVQLISLDPSP